MLISNIFANFYYLRHNSCIFQNFSNIYQIWRNFQRNEQISLHENSRRFPGQNPRDPQLRNAISLRNHRRKRKTMSTRRNQENYDGQITNQQINHRSSPVPASNASKFAENARKARRTCTNACVSNEQNATTTTALDNPHMISSKNVQLLNDNHAHRNNTYNLQ